MAFKIFLICAFFALANAGYGDNNCKIDLNFTSGILSSLKFVNEPKKDTAFDEVFFTFDLPPTVTEWDLDYYGDSSTKYIKAEVKSQKVTIKPTEEFRNLEYKEYSRDEVLTLEFTMKFTCGEEYGDTTEFKFVQDIIDTNNHNPAFNRKEYKYHFGMPIKSGAVLTELMEVYAVDVDFSNSKLNFTTNSNDFEILYKKSENNDKVHFATLKTKKELTKGTYSANIVATDMGKQTGEAKVEVKID